MSRSIPSIDAVIAGRDARASDLSSAMSSRPELLDRLNLGHASALILTMDDPVLAVRLVKKVRAWCPDLTIVARARDTEHAAELYRAGATDAVPETLESSLQLSEAVLVDLGMAMGPVIASIHEKRAELRAADHGGRRARAKLPPERRERELGTGESASAGCQRAERSSARSSRRTAGPRRRGRIGLEPATVSSAP